MKRLILVCLVLLLISGSAGAANLVDIQARNIYGTNDTIYDVLQSQLQVFIENDFVVYGMSLGFQIWSPDGAKWDWLDVGGLGTVTHCVTTVAGSRLDPAAGTGSFDMTGFQATEQNIDESGRDTIECGGVAMANGLPTGPLAHLYSYNFKVVDIPQGEILTLCFDSCFVPPPVTFVFVDVLGRAEHPTALWQYGTRCYPVKALPEFCPVWDDDNISLTANHCGSATATLSATDPEGGSIMFALASNDGAGIATVTDNHNGTCTVTYTPAPADVDNVVTITVNLTDAYHTMDDCPQATVSVTVTNNAPTITCGRIFNQACGGNVFVKSDISAYDDDLCDVITYSLSSIDPPPVGVVAVDPATGVFIFNTDHMDAGMTYTVCISASDGFDDAECCFTVETMGCEWYEVQIEKTHNTLQGHYVDVAVAMNKGTELIGGFDFLIGYDASALAFTEAALSDYLVGCGWEYFTYRYNWNGNCGNACPSGLVRVVGLAETNNGASHPNFNCIAGENLNGNDIVTLTFYVSNDRTLECMYLPIRFYWMDCGDNTISVASGDTLAVNRNIYDLEENEIQDYEFGLPGYFGAPDVPCLDGDKVFPIRYIDFINGGIDIVCADSIDARGDINVNGVAYEIADAVMFTNYFINGLSSYTFHVEASIAASDVNADGIALSVADLVYLVRVIVGDANPYPKPLPDSPVTISARGGTIIYDSPVDIGAALLTFQVNGEIGAPQLGTGAATMDLKYAREGNELRVLVYNIGSEMIAAGENVLVTVPGNVALTGAEVATYDGFGVDALIRNLPQAFSVSNYPNPFNPSTKICLALPEASAWSVKIYNVAGQLVRDFSGTDDAGNIEVTWYGDDNNGSQVASGIYFYKAQAGQYSATRKMILMK